MQLLPVTGLSMRAAVEALRRGGCIAHATETCYGLACDMANPDAVSRLFLIKERPLMEPVSALFASVEHAKGYVEWTPEADALARKYLPGPLTMILWMKQEPLHTLFPFVPPPSGGKQRDRRTVGVRISSHPLAHELVMQFGRPLSTTSANMHGKPNPYRAQDILEAFSARKLRPEIVLDSGELPFTAPSTVVDLTVAGHPIVRGGPIKL